MPVNSDKPQRWKSDVALSVDFYNRWFISNAPLVYRNERIKTAKSVEHALRYTNNLTNITPEVLKNNPNILPILRMSTCPPIARDRLIGLSGVSPSVVKCMEGDQCLPRLPTRMEKSKINLELRKICQIITDLLDYELFPWLKNEHQPANIEIFRASTIIADRLCGAQADPIIRNSQEQRQLEIIKKWLEARGYVHIKPSEVKDARKMIPGTFTFRLNVPVTIIGTNHQINIPIDCVIMPLKSKKGDFPLLIEAKSAGDFTNTNKRRKEEAVKMEQLTGSYGKEINYILFLCGYFDTGYLGYEAAEGIDWVWEHRIDDLSEFGV